MFRAQLENWNVIWWRLMACTFPGCWVQNAVVLLQCDLFGNEFRESHEWHAKDWRWLASRELLGSQQWQAKQTSSSCGMMWAGFHVFVSILCLILSFVFWSRICLILSVLSPYSATTLATSFQSLVHFPFWHTTSDRGNQHPSILLTTSMPQAIVMAMSCNVNVFSMTMVLPKRIGTFSHCQLSGCPWISQGWIHLRFALKARLYRHLHRTNSMVVTLVHHWK